MKKFLYIISNIVFIGLFGFVFLNSILPEKRLIIENKGQAALVANLGEKDKDKAEIIFWAVGDIMLNRGVEYMVYEEGEGDFKFPFLKIAKELIKADILFGNLESIISDKGRRVGSQYSFRAEPEAIESLVYAGFDVISVANNHTFDYGRYGMEDSFKRLKEAGIDYVGGGFNEEEVRSGIVEEIRGTKITFLAYTNKGSEYWRAREHGSGIGWLDDSIKDDIEKAKKKSDLVIVSLHTGDEYKEEANQEQKYFSHLAIRSGADLVIGHHPHVIQPVEKYKDGWIAYSLGNFVFDQGHVEGTMEGLLLEVIIKDKKIKEVNPKEIKISEFFQPYLAQEK